MELFGWLSKKKLGDDLDKDVLSNQIATDYTDGALEINDAVNNYILNFDWVHNSQADLIDTYREVALYNEVDFAIEDIVNEMVSFSEDEEPVELDLSDVEDISENIKKKVLESWSKISNLLDLKDTIHRRSKSFYVDGRLAYQKVIDKNSPKKGLINVVELETKYVSKIRNVIYDQGSKTISDIKEAFVYDESILKNQQGKSTNYVNGKQFKEALELNKESVTYVTSGLVDSKTGWAISWLHKAIRPANQLNMMENALVIYRIARAPERRVFYVDVGNLPKSKAEQYITNLKNSYKNKMTYDPEKGSFKDTRHLMTMQEDFWMPRNSGGKGTEVTTLAGGDNLGNIEDVLYFLRRLYKALNIPVSRLEQDSLATIGGRSAEINRDELKFSKFVSKIRKRFNMMFKDLLRTDLILSNIITDVEWKEIEHKLKFIYAQDMYLEERKYFEMTRDRLELAKDAQDYVGKYFSNEFIRREILRQTDEEIVEMDKQIKLEKSNPQYKEAEEDIPGRSF